MSKHLRILAIIFVLSILVSLALGVTYTDWLGKPESLQATGDDVVGIIDDPNGTPAFKWTSRNALLSNWTGSTAITTLGTVGTGTWNADFQADIVKDTDIDWGAGAGQVDADDVPESATNFWAASDGLGGNDTVKDTMIDWGAGAGQVDLADIPGGTAGADTFNFSAATVTLPSRQANSDKHYTFNLFNPNALYADDTQICVDPKTDAALTITNIEVTCDADPATELDFNLKFADAFIGLANATLIVAMDTANGAASIAAGFNDPTVPASKCIYVEFDAEPDSAITQVSIKVKWDYD